MKYLLYAGWLWMFIAPAGGAMAQDDLKTALKSAFDAFDSATTTARRVAQADRIALIAVRWDNEWITHYYAAYMKAVLSQDKTSDESKRDALLDGAESEIEKASRVLGHENGELEVLAAFVASCRIGIEPMTRYPKYGKVYSGHLKRAKDINPANPRIYYLQGSVWYGMPKFAGGGPTVALPYLQQADSLYARERNDNILHPYWGKESNRLMLERCRVAAGNGAAASGTWTGSLPRGAGQDYPLKYLLSVVEGKLSGSAEASGSIIPITEGQVRGDSLSFYVEGMGENMLHQARYYPAGDSLGLTFRMGGRMYHAKLVRMGK